MNKHSDQWTLTRDQLIDNIFDILNNEELNHQNTTLSKTALWAIGIKELQTIHRFLSQWVKQIDENHIFQRPICPVGNIRQQNQATVWYKRSMIKHIESFWLDLSATNPCKYTPGILERIANRCNIILQK